MSETVDSPNSLAAPRHSDGSSFDKSLPKMFYRGHWMYAPANLPSFVLTLKVATFFNSRLKQWRQQSRGKRPVKKWISYFTIQYRNSLELLTPPISLKTWLDKIWNASFQFQRKIQSVRSLCSPKHADVGNFTVSVGLQGAGTAKKYAKIHSTRAQPFSLYTPQRSPHLLVNNKFERDIFKGSFT